MIFNSFATHNDIITFVVVQWPPIGDSVRRCFSEWGSGDRIDDRKYRGVAHCCYVLTLNLSEQQWVFKKKKKKFADAKRWRSRLVRSRRGPTWPACPLCTCVPRGVGVSAAARRLAATGSKSPPWSRPRRMPVRSPDSSSTSRRSTYCYLGERRRGEEKERVSARHEARGRGTTVVDRIYEGEVSTRSNARSLTLSWPLINKFWA